MRKSRGIKYEGLPWYGVSFVSAVGLILMGVFAVMHYEGDSPLCAFDAVCNPAAVFEYSLIYGVSQALVGLGAVVTAGGVYYLVKDGNLLMKAICLFGGLAIGAMIGATVFLKAFANPITRKVCGVSDTRLLT